MIKQKWKKRLLKNLTARPVEDEQGRFDRVQIATCIILLEVAKYDDEFSSIEKETMKAIMKNDFSISGESIEDLMKVAEEQREESVDIWEFTNVINQHFSREEKLKMMEAAWKIIYADEKLNKYENHYVHVLANLLRLRHADLIDAKLFILHGDE